MKSASHYKWILFLLAGALAASIVVFCAVLSHAWREARSMRAREAAYKYELDAAREDIRRKEAYFNRLMTDSEFFERIVRQRLGYSREDEVLFRFEK